MPPDSVRSRSGCITCRTRKKKCDEVFDEQGICGRCHHGSFQCVRTGKAARQKSRTVASSTAPATDLGSALVQPPSAIPVPPTYLPVAPPPPSLAPPPPEPRADLIDKLLVSPLLNNNASLEEEYSPRGLRYPYSTLPHHSPGSYQAHTLSPTTPVRNLDPVPLEAIPSTSSSQYGGAPGPSDELLNFFESLDGMTDPGQELRSLWDAFPGYALLAGMDDEDEGKGKGKEVVMQPPPRPKHCEKPEHLNAECDCTGPSPMYANLNDDFYQSIPKPVREIVKMVTGDVAASHDLTRAASMALVLLYRARTSHADGGEEAKAVLLKQSNVYFQQAIAHLEKAAIPLEAQLIAMADMQLHQFDQAGAAAAYAILLVGEFFITTALGPRPTLDLATLGDPTRIGMWMFVFADVLRSVSLRHKRTVFDFVGSPGELALFHNDDSTTSASMPYSGKMEGLGGGPVDWPQTPAPYATHLGLPVGLMLCLAATSNLSADMANGMVAGEVVEKKAEAIETAIAAWYPYPVDMGMESMAYVDTVVTQEMWRQAALIYLYQTVRRKGILCEPIQQAARQILQLGARKITPPSPEVPDSQYAGSFRAGPWFLCATAVFEPGDRDVCREALKGCGPQKAYRDNLAAVERIWEVMDRGGWCVDWKEVTEREGIFVAFL